LIRGIGHEVEGFARYVGQDGVRYLQRAGIDSVELVRQRITANAIACDLRWGFCELANTAAQFAAFKQEQASLGELGYAHETRLVGPEQIRQQVVDAGVYAGGLIDMGSGHLHPLDLVQGEARLAASLGVRIFEQSPVLEILHGPTVEVRCATGSVRAGSLVLGCNAHLMNWNHNSAAKCCPPAVTSSPPSRWTKPAPRG
jgi:glycine/D-amino acid oxidase-like deaminating enzyme